jgi:hypothetical protein
MAKSSRFASALLFSCILVALLAWHLFETSYINTLPWQGQFWLQWQGHLLYQHISVIIQKTI